MKAKIKIACLPVAGIQNPYQYLMIEGLNTSKKLNAFNGIDDRFFGIYKTVHKYHPDYIHFDWINSYYQRRTFWMTLIFLPNFIFQVLYIKVFTSTKIVWTLHNILPHNANHIRFHRWVRSWFGKKCEWVRVFSNDSIRKASKDLKLVSSKFITIPEGDYSNIYPNNMSQIEARKILNISPDKYVLLSLGYIKPYKGIEKLIDSFSKLNKKKVELLIAGEGIDKEYIRSLKSKLSLLNEKRIRLIDNFIPMNDLQIYFNAADLVVLPFDKVENSGSAIMAMGFKKPVLAPKMGVLKKRLGQQDQLLYKDLTKGLEVAISLNRKQLHLFGEKNYLALQNYQWKDFGKCFDV
ncbi:glycosyltransferase [Lutimonas zeaxanthinifaciens]|uniref:glycosyltransferase n=1 Tax=Lutimonas zeaxanthinifaciens TaxID=3060215 RepID=UPI00265CB937|nr:glycosyltransferase [Lutimonas sp. YSD2104]WKK67359.1 glycosyltransferase [Lutimonas sp. YSD2104]